MPEGGCLCGAIRISLTGDPATQIVCHCSDCRKLSGSAYSTNLIVPAADLHLLQGTPKTFDKLADSGNNLRSFFCDTCGTTCYRDAELLKGMMIVKAGVMDVVEFKPAAEIYVDARLGWIPKVEGTTQSVNPLKEGLPQVG